MSRGGWSIVFALVGWLALGGQAPSTKGIASPTPAPKEQANKPAQSSDRKPNPLAVTIVESPVEAKRAERRESESRKHDAEDLDAQIGAAQAAKDQVFPSWLGAILSFIGTLLIIWTLFENRKANKIAERALNLTRELFDLENQPLLHIEGISPFICMESGDGFFSNVRIGNIGKLPAKNVFATARFRRCNVGEGIIPGLESARPFPLGRIVVPGHPHTAKIPYTDSDWEGTLSAITNGEIVFVVNMRFSYDRIREDVEHLDAIIVFGKDGPRAPSPDDNLRVE